MKHKFPDDFLWGVAYSSHQVEGNNFNNDWWEWEKRGKTKEKSGLACDSWNRYSIDHKLAQDLGCNAFRLSLEWSRIEPKEGAFSEEAIGHYRKVLKDLKRRGMKRCVTLWHWTSPLWFTNDYGWHKKESVGLFVRYCKKVVKELGDEIDILISLNEPRLPLNKGYLLGQFPPGMRNPFLFKKARKHMIETQKKCYKTVKKTKKEITCCLNEYYSPFYFSKKLEKISFITKKIENFFNWKVLDEVAEFQDVIGIDYYRSFDVNLFLPSFKDKSQDGKFNDLAWGIWPEGVHKTLIEIWDRYHKPIYIFENGLADKDDKHRAEFIREHLRWLHKAISEGVEVRGYFHWSLIDNFEWNAGFEPRFGLCEMDYKTMQRKPRPSYYEYQKIIKNNGF
jgi:beta-glucosidase